MARASRRKFHYIYRITNKLNGKFYIGMHSTDNVDDGYFGSGTRLWKSINKHGKENHEIEILEHYFCREDLASRERQLVDKELLGNPQCLNIRLGGDGGDWSIHNKNPKNSVHRIKGATLSNKTEAKRKCSSVTAKRTHASGKLKPFCDRTGRKHTTETIEKLKQSHKGLQDGNKNSQFGTCWISHELVGSKKCKFELLPEFIEQGWIKGRNKI